MTMMEKQRPAGRPVPSKARPAQAGTTGLTGKEIMRIIRHRWLMIAIFLASFTVLSVVGTVVWRMYMPQYQANALVELQPPKHSMDDAGRYRNSEMLDRHKKSKADMVKLDHVLREALKSSKIKATGWFKRMTANDPEHKRAILELQEEISVNLMPQTDYVKVSMSMYCSNDQDKADLPVIVEEVTNAFVDEVNKDTRVQRDAEIDTVTDSWRKYKTTADRAVKEIADKQRAMEVPTRQGQMDSLTQELGQLIQTDAELYASVTQNQEALEALFAQEQQGMLESNSMIQRALESDPILRGLESSLTTAQARMEIVQSKYGPQHQNYSSLKLHMDGLNREIDARRDTLIKSNVEMLKAFFQQELMKAKKQLVENSARREGLTAKRADLVAALSTIDELKETIKSARMEEASYNRRREDLIMLRDKDLPAVLLAPPTAPIEPSGPQYTLYIPLGVVLGLLCGVGLAFLLELTDTSVKTPTDISRRVQLPLLAMVPHADDMFDEIEDFRLACLGDSHSMVTEAFRELRTNLEFSGPAEQRRTLLVTSPSPEDGRTCVASNMGVTIANSGRRVLLVDANFRRPSLSHLFGGGAEQGFSDVLSGQAAWSDCVQQTDVANLSVMAAGKLPPNPAELLGSKLARDVLDEMIAGYDQVIFDGPPLLLITDARVLAQAVEGVVVVVRAGVNTYGIVQRCRGTLDQMGAHVVGGVLNGVRTTAGGYLQKNYDAFQDYHEVEV